MPETEGKAGGAASAADVPCGWSEEYGLLEETARRNGLQAALGKLEDIIRSAPAATEAYLIAGRFMARLEEHEAAVRLYRQASQLSLPGALDENHPDTGWLAAAQLALRAGSLPCREAALGNLRSNLKALQGLDPGLAKELTRAPDAPGMRILEIWGKRVIASEATRRIALSSKKVEAQVVEQLRNQMPILFCGAGSGQEALFCLEHGRPGFLGMTAPIYILEKDAGILKIFLMLEDIGPAIAERRLILFGGPGWSGSLRAAFSTGRLPPPALLVGDRTPYTPHCDEIHRLLEPDAGGTAAAAAYYVSPEFKARLQAIREGRILPRILLLTCRWTTVLQYVCESFSAGFRELGCETETIIEASNSERLSRRVYQEALLRLKPDAAFAVTHSRLSYDFLPPKLPFICFAMDNIGPILENDAVGGRIGEADLFFCISQWFMKQHARKGIPEEQIFLMMTPADPKVYRPLHLQDPRLDEFRADVSFMKHGGEDPERCLLRLEGSLEAGADAEFDRRARIAIREIHRRVSADRSRSWFEEDFWAAAVSLLGEEPAGERRETLRVLLTRYLSEVYAVSYRQHYLEPLAASGLRLALYGNGWSGHPAFSKFSRGSLPPGEKLNAAYNGSAILLNIHQGGTMHQRIVEGALAGGFFLINRLDAARNHIPAEDYFEEGKEFVYFDSAADLLDKSRHYLEHPFERREIAARARERALRDHTSAGAAGRILETLRGRLAAIK